MRRGHFTHAVPDDGIRFDTPGTPQRRQRHLHREEDRLNDSTLRVRRAVRWGGGVGAATSPATDGGQRHSGRAPPGTPVPGGRAGAPCFGHCDPCPEKTNAIERAADEGPLRARTSGWGSPRRNPSSRLDQFFPGARDHGQAAPGGAPKAAVAAMPTRVVSASAVTTWSRRRRAASRSASGEWAERGTRCAPPASAAVALGRLGCLLEHHVRVGPAESEGADSGDPSGPRPRGTDLVPVHRGDGPGHRGDGGLGRS